MHRQPPSLPAPRLALVLGSGGVRSVAALGIVEELGRAGVFPDLYVGCSSGAVFAAALAVGMPTHEALRAAIDLWSPQLTERRRWWAFAQLLAPRLAGFDATFSLRDSAPIAQRLERAFGDLRVEDAHVPLRIGATDAATGDAVVLTHGRLVDALCASVAVPFVFPSVRIDERRLCDGVLSDPLPIAAARDAALVLALGLPGAMPRRVDRASRLFAQVSTAMINNLQQARTQTAIAAGCAVLQFELDLDRRVGLWQTDALPDLYVAGERAARSRLPEILERLERLEQPRCTCAS